MSYSVLRPVPLRRPVPIPRRPAPAETVVTRGRTQGTFARTFLLFWFVVGMFGGVVAMKTAVGHSPAAQHVAKQIRSFFR